MADGARRCAFCGGGNLSKEHVLPRWLGRVLHTRHPRGVEVLRIDAEPVRITPSAPFTTTVRQVCAACNHGWMNDLEVAARPVLTPLLRGEPSVLDVVDQQIVATWALKTTMMAQYLWSDRPIPSAHYAALRRLGEPPPGYAVWVGAADPAVYPLSHVHLQEFTFRPELVEGQALAVGAGALHPRGAVHRVGPHVDADADAGEAHRGYLAILVLGALVLHIFATRGGYLVPTMPFGYFHRYLLPVWPASGLAAWPPDLRFATWDELAAFAECLFR